MIGFLRKRKLLQLKPYLLSLSLSEVIQRFVPHDSFSDTLQTYNGDLVSLFEGEVQRGEKLHPFYSESELWTHVIEKLKLPPEVVLMSAAKDFTSSLRMTSKVSISEAYFRFGRNEGEMASWFFNQIANRYGVNCIIPLVFPPKRGNEVEDFGLSHQLRSQVLSVLLSRMKDTNHFVKVLSTFVSEHPYFYLYPINASK